MLLLKINTKGNNKMKKIAIIPARSGSKGLPNKNILNLCGKPLIAWTIEAAIKSNCFDRVIVSTDSEEYGEISKKYGAEVIYREENISKDNTPMYDVIESLFQKIDINLYDYFVLLQPTSPLRNEKNIKEAINLFETNFKTVDTLVSVTKADKSSILINKIDDDLSLKYFDKDYSKYSRQNYKEYEPNGAIFMSKIDFYLKNKQFFVKTGIAYIMDKESSIDIDDKIDFELAIILMNKIKKHEILIKNINEKIKMKSQLFKSQNRDDIVIIGHSIIDDWNVEKINNKNVVNLGIDGISSFEYNDLILSKNLLKCNSNTYVIMFGTNDIIYNKTSEEICNSILKTINYIKKLNSNAKIYFIMCLNVNGRMDRSNITINNLNDFIKQKLNNTDIKLIYTEDLNDKYGNLDIKYTYDGLHLNENGYAELKKIVEKALQS